MAKQLKDILNGKKASKTEKLKLGDAPGVDYAPKPEAEQNWLDNHTVEKHADRVGNEDDVYNASNIKRAELGRHGHVPKPKDLKAYTSANEELTGLDALLAQLDEALILESENKKTEAFMARELLTKIKADKDKAKLEKKEITESCTFENLHNTLANKGFQKTHTIHDGDDDTHLYKKAGSLYSHEHLVVHRKKAGTSWYHGGSKASGKEGKGNDSLIVHLGEKN